MIGTTARWLAPLLLDRMAVAHPKVRLVIGDGTSATLEPHLASGSLDAAVVNLPAEQPGPGRAAALRRGPGPGGAGRPRPGRPARGPPRTSWTAFRAAPAGARARPSAIEIDEACRARRHDPHRPGRARRRPPDRVADPAGLRPGHPARHRAPARPDDGFARVSVAASPAGGSGVVLRRRGRPSAPARAMLEDPGRHGGAPTSTPSGGLRTRRRAQAGPQLAQHVQEDPAVAVVLLLLGGVDPQQPRKRYRPPAVTVSSRGSGAPSARPSSPVMSKTSSPVSPSEAARLAVGNCSGRMPMPTRLERWIRSKLSASTARTPSRAVPLAAQSRDEPGPVLLAGQDHQRHPVGLVALGRVVDRHLLRRRAGGG